MSLRTRLILGTACGLSLSICAGFVAAYLVIRSQLHGEIDRALKNERRSWSTSPGKHPCSRRPDLAPSPDRHPSSAVPPATSRSSAERDRSRSPGESVRLPTGGARAVAAGTAPAVLRRRDRRRHARAHLHRPPRQRHGRADRRPLTEVDNTLARIRLLLLLLASITIAGAAAAGMVVARAILRPVQRLTEDAEQIAATGDLGERTDERRSDELGRLARAFNTMLDTLARSISAQRQLVADASHELRTPLASARANLELVELHDSLPAEERRRLLAEAGGELREMTNLVEELLELARVDAHIPETRPVRLDHLAEEAVATASRRSASVFQADLNHRWSKRLLSP